jgi:uncharacterized Zn-finger protein
MTGPGGCFLSGNNAIIAPGSTARVPGQQENKVPNPHTAEQSDNPALIQSNAENHYEVTRADLPLHCPLDGMSLWNSHPRVYLSIETTGKAKCPYCGADYTLVD